MPRIPLPVDPSIYVWVFQVVLSLMFPHQNLVYTCPLPVRATCPVQVINLLIMLFTPLRCYLVALRPNTVLSTLFSHP